MLCDSEPLRFVVQEICHNNDVLAAIGMLSQMELAQGSISVKGLDLAGSEVGFEQQGIKELNWIGLADAFPSSADMYRVSVPALQGVRDHATFFRESLIGELKSPESEDARSASLQL